MRQHERLDRQPFGASAPGYLDRAVLAATGSMPANWLGLRLAIGLRRITTMRLSGDGGLDVERFGLRMRLHPRRNGCEKNLLFTPQMYEVPERAELAAQIDGAKAAGRPFVFVDIGANVGLFSLFVASRIGQNGLILAIEPEAENLRRLRFNVEANPGVPIRVIATALGERSGTLALHVDLRDRGGTRTRPCGEPEQSADQQVECRTLLQVLTQAQVHGIDALKIDVEGAESSILLPFFRDAPQTLWPRLLILESADDPDDGSVYSSLLALGYRVSARSRLNLMLYLTELAR